MTIAARMIEQADRHVACRNGCADSRLLREGAAALEASEAARLQAERERDEAIEQHGVRSGFWGKMAARATRLRKEAEQRSQGTGSNHKGAGMRKLIGVVLFCLVGMASEASAQQCFMQRSQNFWGPNTDTWWVNGEAQTSTMGWNPSSYNAWWWCPTGNPGYTEVRDWVEGKQGPADWWQCQRHNGEQNVWNVCQAYVSNGGLASTGMSYNHHRYVEGRWGFTSQHFWNGTGVTVYNTRNYYISQSAACAELGAPWYWDGGSCVDGGGSPIVMPVRPVRDDDKTRYRLTAPSVAFDIDCDGDLERIGWTAPGSGLAFLAYDRNGNGRIDNGCELFGVRTVAGAVNGFQALDKIEPQANDGRENALDANDPLFAKLVLWEDRNGNGDSTDAGEVQPLSNVYSSVGLGYSYSQLVDEHGNKFSIEGWAEQRTAPGLNRAQSEQEHLAKIRKVWDIVFVIEQ
jgi:hypothetical protein